MKLITLNVAFIGLTFNNPVSFYATVRLRETVKMEHSTTVATSPTHPY